MTVEDFDIIRGCKKNVRSSQQELLEKYSGYLMAVIRRYCKDNVVAQDIIQETWIQIFKNIKSYEEKGLLRAWMAKIAISKCYKQFRKSTRIDDLDQLPDAVDNTPNVIDHLQYEDLMKIVNTIGKPRRDVFVMKIIDGLSHKEISSILEIKESTSRAHLSNARKELRILLATPTMVL